MPEGLAAEDMQRALQATGWHGRTVYDARRKCLRALPIDYPQISRALETRYSLRVEFEPRPALEHPVEVGQQPRPYQSDALRAWEDAGHRGVVVLPTGAGKTL